MALVNSSIPPFTTENKTLTAMTNNQIVLIKPPGLTSDIIPGRRLSGPPCRPVPWRSTRQPLGNPPDPGSVPGTCCQRGEHTKKQQNFLRNLSRPAPVGLPPGPHGGSAANYQEQRNPGNFLRILLPESNQKFTNFC
jgi:hypothetical protein